MDTFMLQLQIKKINKSKYIKGCCFFWWMFSILFVLQCFFFFFFVSPQAEDEEEEDQPLSLSWPESNRKRFTYLFIIPIVLPLWLTLPDVRKPVCVLCMRNRLRQNSSICMCAFAAKLTLHFWLSLSFSHQRSSSPSPSWVPSAGLLASRT